MTDRTDDTPDLGVERGAAADCSTARLLKELFRVGSTGDRHAHR